MMARKRRVCGGPSKAQVALAAANGDQSSDELELYEQIGRLKMEVEWLKKAATIG